MDTINGAAVLNLPFQSLLGLKAEFRTCEAPETLPIRGGKVRVSQSN